MANYSPDYLVHPGEHLHELLEVHRMTQAELSRRTGLSEKHISHIINGKASLTHETAAMLELVFPGHKASYWNSLQSYYEQLLTKRQREEYLKSLKDWVSLFPYLELAKRGAVTPARSAAEKVESILQFFRVASKESWERTYRHQLQVTCRSSNSAHAREEKKLASFASWYQLGQMELERMDIVPLEFDRVGLVALVPTIRSMCRSTDIESLCEQLKELLLSVGVVLLFVRELKGMGVYGFSSPPSGGDPAVIQLSMYRKTHDQFCFSLFHEIGHLLFGDDEEKANSWAADTLIDPGTLEAARFGGTVSEASVRRFAEEIDVHPGIVVGRLQRDRVIPHRNLNRLKQSYTWTD